MSNQHAEPDAPCCTPLVREPLTEDWAGDLSRMFKALADPVRLRLLSLIASHEGGEACVCDISGRSTCPSPPSPTTSKSTVGGLLDCERRGILGLLLGDSRRTATALRSPGEPAIAAARRGLEAVR